MISPRIPNQFCIAELTKFYFTKEKKIKGMKGQGRGNETILFSCTNSIQNILFS